MDRAADDSPRLGTRVWTEIDAARPLLLVPIGSCEQHGPHLPLDTDTRIAVAVAEAAAASIEAAVGDVRAMVAPPVTVSASGEHQGFPGTLSIGSAAIQMVLVELIRSADWSDGVVLVNGHGGNLAAVDAAVAVSTADGRRVLAWWPRVVGGDAHAGRTETSLLLAIAPDLVRLDRAEPGNTDPVATLMPRLVAGGTIAVSPNGVLGDPAGANADEGHRILAALVADLVGRIERWRTL